MKLTLLLAAVVAVTGTDRIFTFNRPGFRACQVNSDCIQRSLFCAGAIVYSFVAL
jgi:hypothetical protein